jgi:crooked neck
VWKTFEASHGSAQDVAKVEGMMPIVSKKRHVDQETGQTVEGLFSSSTTPALGRSSMFTDWDLVFADDERESNPTSFKFLQMAHAWKQTQGKGGPGAGGGSGILAGFKAATKAAPAAASQDDAISDVASSHGGESD